MTSTMTAVRMLVAMPCLIGRSHVKLGRFTVKKVICLPLSNYRYVILEDVVFTMMKPITLKKMLLNLTVEVLGPVAPSSVNCTVS